MLLIDASNINSGGGVTLLLYLIESLQKSSIDYHVITDSRWEKNCIELDKQTIVSDSVFNRKKYLKDIVNNQKPQSILFLGNFPPPLFFKEIKTFTYIQNRYISNCKNIKFLNIRLKIHVLLTIFYIKWFIKNSNYYIFQTNEVKSEFWKTYKLKNKGIKSEVIPFFNDNLVLPQIKEKKLNTFIYVSNGAIHKNHNRLFGAWYKLALAKLKPILYITLDHNEICQHNYYKLAIESGANIITLGNISYNEVIEKCAECEFAIFPSLLETIGLNLIEATNLHCKVIASDLPYIDEIIVPSLKFDPYSIDDIFEKIKYALQNNLPHSKVIMKNQIDNLLKVLS